MLVDRARRSVEPLGISKEWAMLPFWIFLAFMGGVIVGSLVANALGVLPDAQELEQQDHARFAKIERSQ
jgi:hypothetical protein